MTKQQRQAQDEQRKMILGGKVDLRWAFGLDDAEFLIVNQSHETIRLLLKETSAILDIDFKEGRTRRLWHFQTNSFHDVNSVSAGGRVIAVAVKPRGSGTWSHMKVQVVRENSSRYIGPGQDNADSGIGTEIKHVSGDCGTVAVLRAGGGGHNAVVEVFGSTACVVAQNQEAIWLEC